MHSIQQLHDAADKEREKADSLRREAMKDRQKAEGAMKDPQLSQRYANDGQKNEENAAEHDRVAMKFVAEATDLEAKAIELSRQKNEIKNSSRSQINKLDQEEKQLRG